MDKQRSDDDWTALSNECENLRAFLKASEQVRSEDAKKYEEKHKADALEISLVRQKEIRQKELIAEANEKCRNLQADLAAALAQVAKLKRQLSAAKKPTPAKAAPKKTAPVLRAATVSTLPAYLL